MSSDTDIFIPEIVKVINTLKSRLDDYIQKKADFTAEISTEPLVTTTSMLFYREIIVPFIMNTLLMDNLCANEGICYENQLNNLLKIRFLSEEKEIVGKFSCGESCDRFTSILFPYSGRCKTHNNELKLYPSETVNNDSDIEIEVPGPLGEFAIYSILENFIRNSAKYNKKKLGRKTKKDLEIFVQVLDEGDPHFYTVRLWNNITNPCDPECRKTISEYKDGRIRKKKAELWQYLSYLIKQPIITERGELRKEAWGVAEIKIMATLLQGSTDFMRMGNNVKVINDAGKLVYKFWVMKPKKVAIISRDIISIETKEKLQKGGIWHFSSLAQLNSHLSAEKLPLSSFKFAVIGHLDSPKILEELLPQLPFRILISSEIKREIAGSRKVEKNFASKILGKDTNEEILKEIWQEWIRTFIEGQDNICLHLYLEQDEKTEPTKMWIGQASQFNAANKGINMSIWHKGFSGPVREENRCARNRVNIVFDRHFALLSKVNKKHLYFHEGIDKMSLDFTHLFAPPRNPQFVYEIVESGLLKVVLIDERAAENAHRNIGTSEIGLTKKKLGGNLLLHYGKASGVFICTHLSIKKGETPQPIHTSVEMKRPAICFRLNLDRRNTCYPELYWCTTDHCKQCKTPEKLGMNAMILHQGIVDENVQMPHKEFIKIVRNKIPFMAITSGRGIPPALSPTAKFLPFSRVEEFTLKERIAKYSLSRSLMGLSRRKGS